MLKNFKGLYAANIVPLKKNKKIDFRDLEKHISSLNIPEIDGFLVNGHAGENFSISLDEQVEILCRIRKLVKNKKKLICGLNVESELDGIKYAKIFKKKGADALLIFPPNSWSFSRSVDQVCKHHEAISKSTDIPIFLYQSTIYSQKLNYEKPIYKRLLKIKNIIGVKEGSWNSKAYVKNYQYLKKINPKFLVMASGDEHLLPCFKYGSDGSLISLAIIMPKKIREMLNSIKEKDFKTAKKLDKEILQLAKAIYGVSPASHATARLKYCLKIMGNIKCEEMRSSIRIKKNDRSKLTILLKKIKLIN